MRALLRRTLAGPLPGGDAHVAMAIRPRPDWTPGVVPEGLRQAAGLVLFYPRDDEWWLPLTVRGETLRRHGGQVSLPGGTVDPHETIEEAAVREAVEEVALEPAGLEILGRLSPLHIAVSGFAFHPVVAIMPATPTLVAAEHEVARILEAPLAHLLASSRLKERRQAFHGVEYDVPYLDLCDEIVWGATGMVLYELRTVLQRVIESPVRG